jgi:hypothetical protein
MMKQAQPSLRKFIRRDSGNSEHDPAKLSASLRELALRAHGLVRAADASATGVNGSEQELREVLAQIVRLQRNLGSHQLDELTTYVSALRARVQECLA